MPPELGSGGNVAAASGGCAGDSVALLVVLGCTAGGMTGRSDALLGAANCGSGDMLAAGSGIRAGANVVLLAKSGCSIGGRAGGSEALVLAAAGATWGCTLTGGGAGGTGAGACPAGCSGYANPATDVEVPHEVPQGLLVAGASTGCTGTVAGTAGWRNAGPETIAEEGS